jgi:O-antigen ligase
MFGEVFVRAFARWVPYLTLQYVFIACFSILLFRGVRQKRSHSIAFFFLVLFTLVEVLNNLYPDKHDIMRAILVQSFALLVPVIWGSFNVLQPILINRLLNNIKVASIFLAGIVFVAHITGKINYGLYSNTDASNGLAPVQLSGYLGLGCVLFFLSIMNPEEAKKRTLNMAILAFVGIVMVLTFSRGGIYFLAAVVLLYTYYNRAQMGNYFKLLLFLPIALFIYYYVVTKTSGKIVERYEQEGTSNRDLLINAGFQLFLRHPLAGVGTGNYNTRIVKEKLFEEQSGAHNEFVRAGAEHGILGILFYWSFYICLFFEVWRRRQPQKQYAMYFLSLFCLIVIHNGLKISIQPIILMLVVATPSAIYKKHINVYNQRYTQTRVA